MSSFGYKLYIIKPAAGYDIFYDNRDFMSFNPLFYRFIQR